jgi:hypothetical protein
VKPDPLLLLCGQIVLVSGFFSVIAWIAVYTKFAPWWRNSVGRALVTAKLLIAALFALSILSAVFHLMGLFIEWLNVVLIGAMTPVMLWRIAVWMQLHKAGELSHGGEQAPAAEPAKAEEI